MSSLGPAPHHPGALPNAWDEPPADAPRTVAIAALAMGAVGLAALYVPTGLRLVNQVWSTAEQGHGPLILALCAWLAWQRRGLLAALPDTPNWWLGAPLLALSLAAYVLGHSQGVLGLEAASQIGVLAALLLCFKGLAGLRVMALPLAFMVFTVPLPGILVQTLTMPLKVAVSATAEWLLHQVGYPVARMGVVLLIGQYQLLVADACAGLNSMFTLEALGFLWMSLRPRSTPARDAALALVILPISFTANVVRVMVLVLVTYHFGDAAGQGFAHGFSGIVLFVAAVLMMIVAEAVIRTPAVLLKRGGPSAGPLQACPEVSKGRPAIPLGVRPMHSPGEGLSWLRAMGLFAAMLVAAGLGQTLKPTRQMAERLPAIDLQAQVPVEFAGWRLDPGTAPVLPDPSLQQRLDSLYDQTLARTYVKASGERVMLTIAYGRNQSSEATAVHRPEFCYGAQGFEVSGAGIGRVPLVNGQVTGQVTVQRLVGRLGGRVEPISYWVTLADQATLPGTGRKLQQLRHGLAGEVADGMLVRVSTLAKGEGDISYGEQDRFLQDLARALPQAVRSRYFGA